MGIPHSSFEEKLEKMKNARGVAHDTDLTASDLKELVTEYKKVYQEAKGKPFPTGSRIEKPYLFHVYQVNISTNT